MGGGTHYVVAPERSGRSGCHDGTDELPGGPVSQGAVRVDLVVVGEPGGQGPEYGLCIGAGADADVVALEGPDEPPAPPRTLLIKDASHSSLLQSGLAPGYDDASKSRRPAWALRKRDAPSIPQPVRLWRVLLRNQEREAIAIITKRYFDELIQHACRAQHACRIPRH